MSLDGIRPRDQSRWLDVLDDERGTLRLEFWRGYAFVHTTFRKRIAAMRFGRRMFPHLKRWLKAVGHEFVYVYIPEGDEMLHRFQKYFGFVDVHKDGQPLRVNGHIFMAQRC